MIFNLCSIAFFVFALVSFLKKFIFFDVNSLKLTNNPLNHFILKIIILFLNLKKQSLGGKIDYFIFILVSYCFVFFFTLTLGSIHLGLIALNFLKSHLLKHDFGLAFNFCFKIYNHLFLLKLNTPIKFLFKKKFFFFYPDYKTTVFRMENFYWTQYGPTLIDKDHIIIILSLKNFFKTFFLSKKIFFFKKLIKIDFKFSLIREKEAEEYYYINKLLRYYKPYAINYWSFSKILYVCLDYPFTDCKEYKKYKIKSISITHEKNSIIFSSSEKDFFLLLHLIFHKISFISLYDISLEDMYIDEIKIECNMLEVAKNFSANKKIILKFPSHIDEDFLIPLMVYPMFDDNDDFDIIKKIL